MRMKNRLNCQSYLSHAMLFIQTQIQINLLFAPYFESTLATPASISHNF